MSQHNPLVCIYIPTYQSAATIGETLQSLLDQTYTNLAIHVVDNVSTDDTVLQVQRFVDPRIHVHSYQEHVSAEENYNRCIQLAYGDYTAIYHADDVYEKDMVKTAVAFLENTQVGMVLTEAYVINENSEVTGHIHMPKDVLTHDATYDFETIFQAVLKHSNFMVCPSAMFKTDVLKHTVQSWFHPKFGGSSELDVWFRVAKKHRLGLLAKPLMRYRISQKHLSFQVRRATERTDFFHVMDYYLALPDVQSFIKSRDLRRYQALERRGNVMYATNLFMKGRLQDARTLCYSLLSLPMLLEVFKNKRGQLTFCLNGLLRVFILFRMEKTGQLVFSRLLTWIKR